MSPFYVVLKGRKRGIYGAWHACELQVRGFEGARWHSCDSLSEAKEVLLKPFKAEPTWQVLSAEERPGDDFRQTQPFPSCSWRPERSESAAEREQRIDYSKTSLDNGADVPRGAPSNLSPRTRYRTRETSMDDDNPEEYLTGKVPGKAAEERSHSHTPYESASDFGSDFIPLAADSHDHRRNVSWIPSHVPRRSERLGDLDQHRYFSEQDTATLTEEQQQALDIVREGKNLFLTGSAGTGKSTVLREIIRQMRATPQSGGVAITALTGVAAEIVGGCTLHSLLGIGIPVEKKDFGRMWKNQNRTRLRELNFLVIDEVSMLSGEMLDLMDIGLKAIREDERPFGGLQVLFSGDFCQLPPIVSRDTTVGTGEHDLFLNRGYAFESNAWQAGDLATADLKTVHRQKDTEFSLALGDLRSGVLSNRLQRMLQSIRRPLPNNSNGIEATTLYCDNRSTDAHNLAKLASLKGHEHEFAAKDDIKGIPPDFIEPKTLKKHSFWNSCRARKSLKLKVGAQVMLLKNLDIARGLVNGSRGVVTGFYAGTGEPLVKFNNGNLLRVEAAEFSMEIPGLGTCIRKQTPLALAWSMTVHKSQGMTIDRLRVDLSNVFAHGQAYVALSRARSQEALELIGNPPLKKLQRTCNKVNDFELDLEAGSFERTGKWGVVKPAHDERGSKFSAIIGQRAANSRTDRDEQSYQS